MDKPDQNKRKNPIQTVLWEGMGRVPPQVIDMEEYVLGAIIFNGEIFSKLNQFLKAEMFYKDEHQKIFQACKNMYDRGEPIDLILITHELRKMGVLEQVGGAYYTTQLVSRISGTGNVEVHSRIIFQTYMARELIRISHETMRSAYEDTTDIFELLDQTQEMLSALNGGASKEGLTKKASSVINKITPENLLTNKVLLSGWPKFDKMISLERNKLLLLGGAAKDGKSKFLAQWMKRLIRTYGDQVMIVWGTFEDSGEDVFYNMISSDLIMKPKDIRLGKLLGKEQRFEQLKAEFEGYPVEFIENSVTSKYLKDTFVYIAKDNPKRIPILIVDNILTLGDRELFRHDNNAMYDYVMDNLHQARNLTKGIVICVHHYKDSQMGPDRLVNGYRPELPDLKGTEAFRRIPNHVMLFNNPHKRKELYKEYGGDMKDILKHLFLIDVGANRDDSSDDDQALIRMFHTLDYSIFEEI